MREHLIASMCGLAALSACVVDEELDLGHSEAGLSTFNVAPWPGGSVPYQFAAGMSAADRARVRDRMEDWELAMSVTHKGVLDMYIDFWECTALCPSDLLLIDTQPSGDGMACSGLNPGSDPERLWVNPGMDANDDSTLLHELGHCIGLSHEHARSGRDRWLVEGTFDYDIDGDGTPDGTSSQASSPLLGNYDYDSTMHYASRTSNEGTTGTLRWTDRLGNEFSRWEATAISQHDISRAMQYYAREHMPAWDFWRSMAQQPANQDSLPLTTLAAGVDPVGTPAIAGTAALAHIFARGDDNALYHLPVINGTPDFPWVEIGCCFDSDPAAVTTPDGRIHVSVVGASSGKVMVATHDSGGWGPFFYISGGFPTGGIETALSGGHLGPAIASRNASTLELFVVRADGRLAVSSMASNGTWGSWITLGSGYTVVARPAAVATDAATIRLALNTTNWVLRESEIYWNAGTPTWTLGPDKGQLSPYTAPGITKRSTGFRTLIRNQEGRFSNRFSGASDWRDIGGIGDSGTGISAVATGTFSAMMVMNGADARGCNASCLPGAPNPGGQRIQAGGIWLRTFE